jgi:CheY-like chemotaxis protein
LTEEPREYRILCVDDEPRVLDGMRRTLGMNFDVQMAKGGAEALAMLSGSERFAVTISDMRMPGMDGATYLEQAAVRDPDMVRMLLTGQADMQAAIRAINHGGVFRFLTKPCDADVLNGAVEDALEQHRLITAEKELLQKTVYGSVQVLTELLGMVTPVAFSHAMRVKRLVQHVARALELRDAWQLDLAVMIAHLGCVGMAPELLERAYTGQTLGPEDKALLGHAAQTAHNLMSNIPRIDAVLAIVARLADPPPAVQGRRPRLDEAALPWALHVILAAERADQLSFKHPSPRLIAEALTAEAFNPAVIEALGGAEFDSLLRRKTVKLNARQLEPGMFLLEDALSLAGVLMAKGGQEITPTVALLLRRMAERRNLEEPLTVSVLVA